MIHAPSEESIQNAGTLLRSGELVAFPTETVYGLGANALQADAVRKIFELKGRPATNPLIVHLSTLTMISEVADVSEGSSTMDMLKKVAPLWPGPLSVILPKAAKIPLEVTAGLSTVAVRIPAHPVAQSLITAAGCPVAAPSANRYTAVSPTRASDVAAEFGEDAPCILDGGPCQVGLESTVLSLLGPHPTILRPGAITREMLLELFPVVLDAPTAAVSNSGPALSPGLAKRHYAPRTRLVVQGELPLVEYPNRVGLIALSGSDRIGEEFDYVRVSRLTSNGDLAQAASALFSAIRELDALNLDLIVVEGCPEIGIGSAIMDRLRKASQPA